ncbi:unnamed protein product, partial [Cyprideis torosa]
MVEGDYLEFGVYRGKSFAEAYHALQQQFQNRIRLKTGGLPVLSAEDAQLDSFNPGEYACSEEQFRKNLVKLKVPSERPSGLEALLANDPKNALADPKLLTRAERLMAQISTEYISKYNNAPLTVQHLELPEGRKVLLVDQTAGDMSLKYGLVDADAQTILQTVLDEQPDATILLKAHPDVIA